MAQQLTDANFDAMVTNSKTPVLVDFYADWCGPCAMQTPILEKWAAAKGAAVTVAKVNVDEAQGLAVKFGIMSIPTLIVFAGGEEKARVMGVQRERELDALLAKAG